MTVPPDSRQKAAARPPRQKRDRRPGPTRVTPPVVPYRAFKQVLHAFRDQARTSEKLDLSSARYKMHSLNRLEMLRALQFLALLDEAYFPSPKLHNLVQALGTSAWPSELRSVLMEAYAELFKVSAVTLSGGSLIPSFRAVYSTEGDTTRRSAEFFIHAAREAAIGTDHLLLRTPADMRSKLRAAVDPPIAYGGRDPARAETLSALVVKFPPFDTSWADDAKSLWLKAYLELVQRID